MLKLTVIAVIGSFLAEQPALAGDKSSAFEVHKSGTSTVKNTNGNKAVRCKSCKSATQRLKDALSGDRFTLKTTKAITGVRN